jgi:NAD(P)H-nitrite reductase large subunit
VWLNTLLSIGENGDNKDSKEVMYRDIKHMIYRKLVLKNGRLHGVMATGPWTQGESMHELVERKQVIWPWQRKQFSKTGQL